MKIKRNMRVFMTFLSLLFLILLAGIVAYDALVFKPARIEISHILSAVNPEDQRPPYEIQQLINIAHDEDSLAAPVTRWLMFRLHLDANGSVGWAMKFFMWESLVRIHYSQPQIMSLYAALAYNGKDNGLNNLSLRLFSKPLSSLNEQESATVVAILKSPTIYLGNKNLLEARRNLLLSKVNGNRER